MKPRVAAVVVMVRLLHNLRFQATDTGIGIAISADGKFIYFIPLASRDLWRVETAALRRNTNKDRLAFLQAANSVQYLGEVSIRHFQCLL